MDLWHRTARDPVVVVGAGLGGLSAALHLAARGRDVLVVEGRGAPGGCCGSVTSGPYRFDTGPSVLTMPDVLAATFGAAGVDMDGVLPLRRLDPSYRLAFPDGSRLDVVAAWSGWRATSGTCAARQRRPGTCVSGTGSEHSSRRNGPHSSTRT